MGQKNSKESTREGVLVAIKNEKPSPFRYEEPTYIERRKNHMPNWFYISDTIGQPYRLDLLRFYFDRSDPQSLVQQLQKHWMAGLIVWRCPTEALSSKHDRVYKMKHMTGKIYLIGWDAMPNDIINEGVWCGAIYPSEFADIARLYVGCPELWDYDWRHSSFWTEIPQPQVERVRRRIQNVGLGNELSVEQKIKRKPQKYRDLQRDVHEWLANTEDSIEPEDEEIELEFPETLTNPDSESSSSDREVVLPYGIEVTSPYDSQDPYSHITYATQPPQIGVQKSDQEEYISSLATWNLEYKSVPYHKWPEEVFAAGLANGIQRAVAKIHGTSNSSSQDSILGIDIYTRHPHNAKSARGAYSTPAHSIYIPQVTNVTSDWSLELLENLPQEMNYCDPAETVLDYRLPKSYDEMKYPDWEPGFAIQSPSSETAGPNDLFTIPETEPQSSGPLPPSSPSSFPSFESASNDTVPEPLKPTVTFATEEKDSYFDDLEANQVTKADLVPSNFEGFYRYYPTVDWIHSEYKHLVQTGNIPKENLSEIMIYGSRGFISMFTRHVDVSEFVPLSPEQGSRKSLLKEMKDSIRNNPIEEEEEVIYMDYRCKRLDVEVTNKDPSRVQISIYEPDENEEDTCEPLPENFLIPGLDPFTLEGRTGIIRYLDSIMDDWHNYGHYDFWQEEGLRFRNEFLLKALAIHFLIGPPDNPYYHEYESFLRNPLIRYFAKLMEAGWPLPSKEDIESMKKYTPEGLVVCKELWDEDEYEWERGHRKAMEGGDHEERGKTEEKEKQGEEETKKGSLEETGSGSEDGEGKQPPKKTEPEKNKKLDLDLLKILLALPPLRRRKQLQLGEMGKEELEKLGASGLEKLQKKERPIWARDPAFPAQDEEAERWLSPEESEILHQIRQDAGHGRLRHWRWWYERNQKKVAMMKAWYKMIDRFWQTRAAAQERAKYRERRRRDRGKGRSISDEQNPSELRLGQNEYDWGDGRYGYNDSLSYEPEPLPGLDRVDEDQDDLEENTEPEEYNHEHELGDYDKDAEEDDHEYDGDDGGYDEDYYDSGYDEYEFDYDSDSDSDDEVDPGDWNVFPVRYDDDEIIEYILDPSHPEESLQKNDSKEAKSQADEGESSSTKRNEEEYFCSEETDRTGRKLKKYVPVVRSHDPEIEQPVFYDPKEFKDSRQFTYWREKVYYQYPHKTYSSKPPPSLEAQAKYWKWLSELS
ncbi:hypothetical protein TWF506_010737 [Arthrobotrys conoides]|uniref:Uncharacterized protein n=1 Tax=Arthrobotrys conoides TaxID=74498 RepID=A0AAN8NI28_9PEZI